ncbi:putative Uridine nucleosidase [Glarea lozoyensis 74030]|uniref:Putative Uridine nucleosidase n=1 Tax=Glarea lozoyensis (strain ATCC 74030 / MF5533) TaxID=1104152 RepID=H0EFC0_GLAL7|nr:putative Uridine nucleosidase [Glarea lozoyensis 74030]
MSGESIPVWLDCDPANTTQNALSLLTAMGRPEVPVYPGAAKSLLRDAVHAPDIHGRSGLDGTDLLPKPVSDPLADDAVKAMAKALLSTPKNSAWLIATGACTNVALLFAKHPEVAAHLKGLSIMGGAIGDGFTSAPMGKVSGAASTRIGNWSEWAEFNILIDPEAADAIFQNPGINKKTILIPLDVTHLVLATPDVLELLSWGKTPHTKGAGKAKTTLRVMLVELLTFFADRYASHFAITAGPPLHDPLAVAAIFDGIPGLEIPFRDFVAVDGAENKRRRERYAVSVITEGSHDDAQNGAQTGRTIVKLLDEGQEGVKIPRGLDVARFWAVLEESLQRADEVNSAKSV